MDLIHRHTAQRMQERFHRYKRRVWDLSQWLVRDVHVSRYPHDRSHPETPTVLSPGRLALATIAAACTFLTASYSIYHHLQNSQSWNRVYTNGRYIGMVPNEEDIISSMERVALAYGVHLGLSPIHTQNPHYDWKPVTALPTKASAIELNGQPLVYLSNQAVAKDTLSEVKRALLPANVTEQQGKFVGKIEIVSKVVGVANILPLNNAVRRILNPTIDHLSGRSGMFPREVSLVTAHAPVAKQTKKTQPLLKVQAVVTETRTVPVPYRVHYIKDNQLGVGETKVVKTGVAGRVREHVKLHFLNGVVSSSQVTRKDVVSPPRSEVVDQGTNSGVASGPWIWPTTGTLITSPFGPRILGGMHQFHPGIDIGVPIGTPVFATNNGLVEQAGWNSGGYGNWVLINNGGGIETVFGHMSRVAVHAGQIVTKGQVIGYSGDTGDSTGPHLHYEVRMDGSPINPMPYS